MVKQDRGSHHQDVQHQHHPEIKFRDQQDIAEQVAHRLDVARGFGDKQQADGHAYGPEGSDGRVFPLAGVEAHQADDDRRQKRGDNGPGQGAEPGDSQFVLAVEPGPDAAEYAMGDGPGNVSDAAGHHVSADDAEGEAGHDAGSQGVAQEGNGRVGQGVKKFHGCSAPPVSSGDRGGSCGYRRRTCCGSARR